MPQTMVLVIEDDAPIRQGIAETLRMADYQPLEAADGEAGLDAAARPEVGLVLLDVLMPGRDGFQVLGELRRLRPDLPVIFLTARGEQEDRVRGLRSGADDYIVKPFDPDELLARVEAVLRRVPARPGVTSVFVLGGRRVDLGRAEAVLPSGESVSLPPREAALLGYLYASEGRVVSRDELLLRVWGIDPRNTRTRTVDMAVARLRDLLQDDEAEPELILTVRGKGYRLGAIEAPAEGEAGTGSAGTPDRGSS